MYKNLKLLQPAEHSFYRYTAPQEFFFAKDLNLIPITYSEIKFLCCKHPIVIIEQNGQASLMLLAGSDKNNLVDESGKWRAEYIPAFLRRYPFTLVKTDENSETLNIGFDFDSGCFSSPEGSPLFSSEGEATQTLTDIKILLEAYQQENQLTQNILALFKERDLFSPAKTMLKNSDGEDQLIDGFLMVDKEKLLGQDDEFLLQTIKNGWMELIELHLFSIKR